MSAAALFTPGAGDFHVPVSVRLADLPRGQQLAAWRVYSAILDFLPRGQTELGERFTDRVLRQSPWLRDYSRRFIQKGLRILTELGIIRRIPQHGRRIIVVVGRLRGSDKPRPRAKADATPAPTRSSAIPNVGIVKGATLEQIAAARAQLEAHQAEPPEPTPEEKAELDQFLEESRRRRDASGRAKLRPAYGSTPPKATVLAMAVMKARIPATNFIVISLV